MVELINIHHAFADRDNFAFGILSEAPTVSVIYRLGSRRVLIDICINMLFSEYILFILERERPGVNSKLNKILIFRRVVFRILQASFSGRVP